MPQLQAGFAGVVGRGVTCCVVSVAALASSVVLLGSCAADGSASRSKAGAATASAAMREGRAAKVLFERSPSDAAVAAWSADRSLYEAALADPYVKNMAGEGLDGATLAGLTTIARLDGDGGGEGSSGRLVGVVVTTNEKAGVNPIDAVLLAEAVARSLAASVNAAKLASLEAGSRVYADAAAEIEREIESTIAQLRQLEVDQTRSRLNKALSDLDTLGRRRAETEAQIEQVRALVGDLMRTSGGEAAAFTRQRLAELQAEAKALDERIAEAEAIRDGASARMTQAQRLESSLGALRQRLAETQSRIAEYERQRGVAAARVVRTAQPTPINLLR